MEKEIIEEPPVKKRTKTWLEELEQFTIPFETDNKIRTEDELKEYLEDFVVLPLRYQRK